MKVLICDDHAVFRAGLRLVLADLADDVELLEAPDGEAALALADTHPELDLVLLDLSMPGVDGWDGLRRFRSHHPALPVVVVSATDDAETVRRVLDAGASGFVPKGAEGGEILAALQLVLSGGVFVPRQALTESPRPSGAEERAWRRERAAGLTPRQIEVLSLMARGLTNREICGVLAIAEGTVKAHIASIFETLDVSNRTEAAVMARELGLKAPGEE
ncbi:MAG: response regulator transcription factor [Myxococcota bacterium]|nr:response regulator transcription factor [Myxococcota bacterium]